MYNSGGVNMEREADVGLVAGLLFGAAIGISLGLLYAPRAGRETRELLRLQADQFKCRSEALGGDLKQTAEQFGSVVREQAREVVHVLKGNGAGKIEA
ncbi:YtxH domain-containing protein [Dehalogenimonas alkenigignens]|nr:YtxH domain-containing protein [Dehalogenimonas alkenigignens]